MSYRFYIILLALVVIIFSTTYGLPRDRTIDEIFAKGDRLSYRFLMKDSAIGTLEVEYKGSANLEGLRGYQFEEVLDLDFSPLGQNYRIRIENKHHVDSNNLYIGDDMSMYINGKFQKLFFKHDGFELKGYSIIDSKDEDLSLPQRKNVSSMDNNLIDQIGLYLSFKELNIGDSIFDTVFVPQNLLISDIEFTVDDFVWARYGEVFDSAYLCRFSRPTEMDIYFTKDKKLIKMVKRGQALEAYLYETPYEKMAPKTVKSFTFSDFVSRLPLFLVYFFFGVICSLPLIRKHYKNRFAYIALVFGALIYTISYSSLFPLQKWYGLNYILPAMQTGGSIFLLGLLPSFISGFILELLKLIPIAAIYFWQKPRQSQAVFIGLMAGIGFGIFEACSLTGAAYQAGGLGILSLSVAERLAIILFHAATGALFGYGVNRGLKHLSIIWLLALVLHVFSDYLILFVQSKEINITLLVIIKSLVGLVTVLASYLIVKNARNR